VIEELELLTLGFHNLLRLLKPERTIVDTGVHAIAIVFDLVHPAIARWRLVVLGTRAEA